MSLPDELFQAAWAKVSKTQKFLKDFYCCTWNGMLPLCWDFHGHNVIQRVEECYDFVEQGKVWDYLCVLCTKIEVTKKTWPLSGPNLNTLCIRHSESDAPPLPESHEKFVLGYPGGLLPYWSSEVPFSKISALFIPVNITIIFCSFLLVQIIFLPW